MEELKNINNELKLFKNKDLNKSLKQAYMSTYQNNEDFRALVNSLKLDENDLAKYTSKLEISAKEISNCNSCPSLLACQNEITGCRFAPKENGKNLIFSYEVCKYKKEQLKQESILDNITCYEIRKEIREASLKDVYKDDKNRLPIIKAIKEFIDNYGKEDLKGFYLHGSFGSGKTYLVAALFNELAKKNIRSAIIYFPEFLRSLKSSFSTDFEDRIEHIKNVDLLLLDDIGAENVTNWSRDEILGTILQHRMESRLPTFFTSNLTIDELEEKLVLPTESTKVNARRIIERVKYLSLDLELIGKNRRK